MSPSATAARKCSEWLQWCKSIGWRESDLPALADLWWEYHDGETGQFVPHSRPFAANERPEG